MKGPKISIKASKSWRNLIKKFEGISTIRKRLSENLRRNQSSLDQECGEALDTVLKRNLAYRLESVVLVENNGSSISRQCQALESVTTRTPTRRGSISTPSSSPFSSPTPSEMCQNLDSSNSIISPLPRSGSLSSESYSAASSIQEQVSPGLDEEITDYYVPPCEAHLLPVGPDTASIVKMNRAISMEASESETHAISDELVGQVATFEVINAVDRDTIRNYEDKLANLENLLVVSNAEIRRLNTVNDGLRAIELKLLERQVVAQEAMSTLSLNQSQGKADARRNDALVEAKVRSKYIIMEVEELDKAIHETRDWKNASDMKVKKGMRYIDEWKEKMNKIINTTREIKILVEKNGITDEDDVSINRVERVVKNLNEEMDAAIVSIESEDNDRALYTLDTTPVRDPAKLPKFSGKAGEDFHLFKEEMDRGFVKNRTPRADQLSKLRECLSGDALMFVPKSTVATIDEAWAVLKKSFGDAYRVIKHRKEELLKVGKFPKVMERGQGGYSQQIVWFVKVENILKGVLDLGKKHPEYSDVAFSFEFISTVVMMFPQRLRNKLCKCPGKKGDQLENILLKIKNSREQAQSLQLFLEASTLSIAAGSRGEGGLGLGSRQQCQGSGGGGHNIVQGPVVMKCPKVLKTEYLKNSKSKPSIKENDDKDGTSKPATKVKSISTKEATRKLTKKLRSSGDMVEVKPVPAGRAQFMVGQTKGRTRPLNILYDTGCYSLLLKEGVQHELGKPVLKTKGPLKVKGVGNSSVKVNDEWLTTLELVDGSRQIVEGWTIEEVTAPLPIVNLSKAVKEIKDNKPDDVKLQSMFVQLVAGGDCDILLGQLYNAIFPTAVHSLPSGLTIYELQIKPHDAQVNSVIGGPHESFEFMAQQVGGVHFLYSSLMEALDNYKSFGPPPVSRSLMTIEDKQIYHKVLSLDDHTEDLMDEVHDDENSREQSKEVKAAFTNTQNEEGSVNYSDKGVEVVENLKVGNEGNEVVQTMFEGSFAANYDAILENLKKFPGSEIRVVEVMLDEANVLKIKHQVENSHEKLRLAANLDENLDFIDHEAQTEGEEAKSLFRGTFLQNYENILENLDKFVNENGHEDASRKETEIIEKNSKSEGSRCVSKVVDGGETLEAEVDSHHKPLQEQVLKDCTVLVACLIRRILTMMTNVVNVMKPSCASLWVPMLEMSPQPSADAHHPGEVAAPARLNQDGPEGGRGGERERLG